MSDVLTVWLLILLVLSLVCNLAYIEAMDEEKDGRMLRQLDAILYRYFEKKEGPKNDQ